MSQPPRRAASVVALIAVGAPLLGCGELRPEVLPYRYRQWLLDDGAEGPAGRRQGGIPRHRPLHARCLVQVGRRYRSSAALIAAVTSLPAPDLRRPRFLRRSSPRVGDLVLFDNTVDSNNNGELDDPRSRAGLVCAAEGHAVRFLYLLDGRARLGQLDLSRPHLRREGARGPIVNSYLRPKKPGDTRAVRYLAGELFAGFAPLP